MTTFLSVFLHLLLIILISNQTGFSNYPQDRYRKNMGASRNCSAYTHISDCSLFSHPQTMEWTNGITSVGAHHFIIFVNLIGDSWLLGKELCSEITHSFFQNSSAK